MVDCLNPVLEKRYWIIYAEVTDDIIIILAAEANRKLVELGTYDSWEHGSCKLCSLSHLSKVQLNQEFRRCAEPDWQS